MRSSSPRFVVGALLAAIAVVSSSASAADRPSTAQPNVQVVAGPEIVALHRGRKLRIYLPPSYEKDTTKRYPVIYMHDAQNLYDEATSSFGVEWGVDEAMNELARTKGFEAIVVGIDHGGEHRNQELSPYANPRIGRPEGAAYMQWAIETLKPWVDARYRTKPDRANTAMIGSSLGGLTTHVVLLRWPQVVGKAGILSPSYWINDAVYAETKVHPWPAGTRSYLYIGGKEDEESVPDVDRMMAVLATQDHPPQDIALHVEPAAQHNETAWKAEFPRVVSWLFELGR